MDKDMKKVMQVIRRHRRFLVTSHVNPEGDALGSALGLASLLKRLGKTVTVGQAGGVPRSFDFFPRVATVLSRPNGSFSAEVSMIVDVPVLSRVGVFKRLIERIPLVVNIDHHVSNERFADVNWVDPKAAAVGEMIYRLYRAFRLKPSKEEALCLYTSLVTDTGSFRYMNTTPAVHRIASELIATGVSPLRVAQELYESKTAQDLRFIGNVLRTIRHSPDNRIAWLEIPLATLRASKTSPDVLDELVNFPRSVRSAQVAFVLRETPEPGKIRVSMRSKGTVNVDRIARVFGGGGHVAASGCTVSGTLAQARAKVLRVVRQALKKKKTVQSY